MDSELKDIKDKAFEATKAKCQKSKISEHKEISRFPLGRSTKEYRYSKIIEDTIGWA